MWLAEWASRWGISHAALADLELHLGIAGCSAMPQIDGCFGESLSESAVDANLRIEARNAGVWLTRNNVGALMDERGRLVRYGLANESPGQNKVIKSGDRVGIRTILITKEHVGKKFGQFVSREVKKQGWKFNPRDPHEVAQLAWINFVISKGGDAAFASGPGTF